MMMDPVERNSQACKDYDAGNTPDAKLMEAIGKLAGELAKAGVLVGTGGLLPFVRGARIRAAGGN